MNKFVLSLSFMLFCINVAMAQTDYYYYNGKRITLTPNSNKVCVSIPKYKKRTKERVLAKVKVMDTIMDDAFDIFVILRPDFEKLVTNDFWKEEEKNVIVTSSYRTAEDAEVFTSPYLNLRLKHEEDVSLLFSYVEEYGLRIVRRDSLMLLWYILGITQKSEKSTLEIANQLFESGKFSESVPDLCSMDLTCSNDPLFNLQWGLRNNVYPGMDISACSAWDIATGKNVKIAIIDTGVDMNHSDLSSNICSLSFDTQTLTSPSIVYRDHGTHCAGIAAAIKDNNILIAGVAPDASIISVSNPLSGSTNTLLKLADGIIWAYQNGADIISNSWHCPTHHAALDEAIQEAFTYGRFGKGCIITFAVGNLGSQKINYPANCNEKILAVGAIDSTGMRAYFSNYGDKLDIVAPGDTILSTIPNNAVAVKSGTSMACPHVAGVAALILERNSELTVEQVNSIINGNAKKLSGVSFNVTKPYGQWNKQYGYGLVDAYNSVINTPNSVYVQNDTITGSRIISADSIYVGNNVTNTKEYGNVILGQGDVSLRAKYIEIKNSTSIPLGTTLSIGK